MAEELNLGLDSFVFIDDSPHEREAMRRMCPELSVPEMPDDPAARPAWLRSLGHDLADAADGEDAQRSDLYAAEKRRAGLRDRLRSAFEDYLRGSRSDSDRARRQRLQMWPRRADASAHQPVQPDHRALRRRGDQGHGRRRPLRRAAWSRSTSSATTACDLRHGTDRRRHSVVQSFLMSCRVIGRAIETAFLGVLLQHLGGAWSSHW